MNITSKWKRLLAVGCSHGQHIDPAAANAVLRFKETWKPHSTVHLGDALDLTAFRSKAKGTPDEAEPVAPDIQAGFDFLTALRPTTFLCGNHEDRLWHLTNHYNAVVAGYAATLISRLNDHLKRLRCELVPYRYKAHRKLGNFKFMHGWYYNENACRDHAEAFGNTVFAHTHRAGIQKGRRDDSPTGICVGTLSNIPGMAYAAARRATLGWSHGFAWGCYTDTRAVIWLHEQPQNQHEWILPA